MEKTETTKVNITINDIKIAANKGDSVLDAAKQAGIKIPHLCYLNMHDLEVLNRPAACRVCMVEQDDGRNGKLVPACATFVYEGMTIKTNSMNALNARRTVVELLLSDHPSDCLLCVKNLNCDLQRFAMELGIKTIHYEGETTEFEMDMSSKTVVKDSNKCILCRRCEAVCANVQSVGVLSGVGRGFSTTVATAFNKPLIETECTFCGQCVAVCPTGALTGFSNTRAIWEVLADPDKYVVVQVAPAVRAALGELFGYPAGISSTGKMVAALRRLGFDKVLDTNFAADVTIMEESTELMSRVKEGGKLPLICSCCPSWIKFCEHQYPDLLDHPSSCKSPQEMFGALAKSYLAQKLDVDPKKIVCVSIMPCLAKKYEASREELSNDGLPNVDMVLSTRELGRMIKEAGISFEHLPNEKFDSIMGQSSGAADIFGTTGGVLEALLRSYYERSTGKTLEKLEFESLRGFKDIGIKEAVIEIDGTEIKVAVAHELRNARILLDEIREGKSAYHAIEIMACPGGCIAGGGQPFHHSSEEILNKRREVLYNEDKVKALRRSHENPEVLALYEEFLGEPNSEKAHERLHTTYVKRGV
ncbi:MAG: NADH-dependent [FeFe] hydrogenase, group A6 [Oscillospiraceae bacterium]|nr:NADH-dependent [FeFe] hydrogenase, group A6 [Oscillospiraceae bacterium]